MRGMRPLVAAQLALAVVVVFAAALLGRSLVNFAKVDPGYDTDHLVSVSFSPVCKRLLRSISFRRSAHGSLTP